MTMPRPGSTTDRAALTAGTWGLIEGTHTAPAGAAQALLVAANMTGTPPAGHQCYVDSATIRIGIPEVASVDLYRRPITTPTIAAYDFETADMSGWGAPHAGVAVRTNSKSHQGSWSYQLTSDGTDALGSHVETVKILCTPGAEYMVDEWIAGSSAAKDTFAQLRFYDAGGGFLQANNGIGKPPPGPGAWEYRWAVGTAPAGATHMTLLAVLDSFPTAGDTIWVDEVRVRLVNRAAGVRVAQGLPANAVYDDWRGVISGVPYEYRAEVRSVIGTTVGGVWTP
ncbi:hypothetical protein AB0C04_28090 [Micromonospora sp. NPDC048909]|uniref:hypothetical protein n=1 Tax=Micromonospora sp. NPDC048909 TaxID=3155643 RepID=UPI0033F05539